MLVHLKRLKPYLYRYRIKLILGLMFVTISNVCSTLVPRLVGGAVDRLGSGSFTFAMVAWDIAGIIALTAGSGLFMFLTRRTIIVSSRLIEYDLRKDLLDSIQSQPISFFNKNATGDLMAHSTNDITAAREFLGPAIMYSANTITTFIFAMYFMLNLSVSITFFALLPLPLIAFGTYLFGKKYFIASRELQEQFSNLTSHAQEAFSGIRIVRAYGREGFERRNFEGISSTYLSKNLRLARLQAFMMPLMMIMVGLSQLTVLGFGGLQVIRGNSTLGDLTQFFIYLNLLIWPVIAIGWVTNLIQRAAASMQRLGKLFDLKPQTDDNSLLDHSITSIEGAIEFKNVSLTYNGSLHEALSDVSFWVPKGTSLGIVGPVGCGKTSIVSLISRLHQATTGEVIIDKVNILRIPQQLLSRYTGVVPQDVFLFSLTIAENIGFGKPGANIEEIKSAATAAQLHDEIADFPDGYDTILGERGITLSGGQKQRVAIASATLRNPSILVFDDAFSAIDTDTEDKILENMKKIMLNRTTIIVSHRLKSVKNADHIIVLDKGRILEQGTHSQLLELGGRYSEMYAHQQLEEEIESL